MLRQEFVNDRRSVSNGIPHMALRLESDDQNPFRVVWAVHGPRHKEGVQWDFPSGEILAPDVPAGGFTDLRPTEDPKSSEMHLQAVRQSPGQCHSSQDTPDSGLAGRAGRTRLQFLFGVFLVPFVDGFVTFGHSGPVWTESVRSYLWIGPWISWTGSKVAPARSEHGRGGGSVPGLQDDFPHLLHWRPIGVVCCSLSRREE